MKRLYIALLLLVTVSTACVLSHRYLHRQTDRMLDTLLRIEERYRSGDTADAITLAENFAEEYRRISDRISCYVAHSELQESRETSALLPSLLRTGSDEELQMELARLRSQLEYLQQVDDPLLRNIL